MTTYQYGTRDNYSFYGYTGKIGKSLAIPALASKYWAADKTGSTAQPCLISQVEIQVGGNTNTTSTKFAIWNSDGSNGTYSSSISLSVGGSNPGYKTGMLSRVVYASSNFIVGFQTNNTASISWNADSTKSGNIIQDTSSATGNFVSAGNYEAGTLIVRFTYTTLPIAPAGLTLSNPSGTTTVNLSWTAPTDNGGSAVTGYRISRSIDNLTWTTIVADTGSTATTYADTGLINGTTYYYRVAALNAVSVAAGSSYSGAWSTASSQLVTAGGATDNISTLSVNVTESYDTLFAFNDTGSGVPFTDIKIVYAGDTFYNSITASGDVGSYNATMPTVIAQYGLRANEIGNLLNNSSDGLANVARNNLWQFYNPQLRVESITVNLKGLNDASKASVLGLEIGDGISVSFTPNKGQVSGNPITAEGYIIGLSTSIDLENQNLTISLANTSNVLFRLNSNKLGHLDQNLLG